MLHMTYKIAKRIVIGAVGASVLLIGVALIFLPGPAFLVIPAGLAILALEFAWARALLKKLRRKLSNGALSGIRNRSEDHY